MLENTTIKVKKSTREALIYVQEQMEVSSANEAIVVLLAAYRADTTDAGARAIIDIDRVKRIITGGNA